MSLQARSLLARDLGQWMPPRSTRAASGPSATLAVATLAGAEGIRSMLQGPADYFATVGLPEWLIHW